MMRLILVLAAIGWGGAVSALSCSGEGSVAADYEFAALSEADYLIAIGRMENVGPRRTIDDEGSYRQSVRLVGEVFVGGSFAPGWSAEIEVTGLCAGGGCGYHSVDREGLFFIERTEAGLSFLAGPCGGLAHYDPGQAEMEAVIQCHAGQCE